MLVNDIQNLSHTSDVKTSLVYSYIWWQRTQSESKQALQHRTCLLLQWSLMLIKYRKNQSWQKLLNKSMTGNFHKYLVFTCLIKNYLLETKGTIKNTKISQNYPWPIWTYRSCLSDRSFRSLQKCNRNLNWFETQNRLTSFNKNY